nr:MAG TPA: hypothetical protein [Caudoviricetes sp.]
MFQFHKGTIQSPNRRQCKIKNYIYSNQIK